MIFEERLGSNGTVAHYINDIEVSLDEFNVEGEPTQTYLDADGYKVLRWEI